MLDLSGLSVKISFIQRNMSNDFINSRPWKFLLSKETTFINIRLIEYNCEIVCGSIKTIRSQINSGHILIKAQHIILDKS